MITFKYLPFKYKSLEDYSKSMNLNDVLYQSKFQELAYRIFKKRGLDFMCEYLDRYKTKYPIDKSLLLERSISDFKEMEPEIFNDWLLGMRKTYHPYLVICILVAIIGFIRSFDNSCSIFTQLGLKTKKRYRVIGVPAIPITSKLKSIENLRIKRKLRLIITLRPIMYICILLLVILLIIRL